MTPPMNSAARNCQPMSDQQDDAELDDQVGGGKHEHHGGQEVSAAHEDRPGHGGGRVGTA